MSAPLSQPNGYTLNTPRLIIRTAQSHDVGPLHAYLTTPANYGTVADLTIESLRERIDKWAASTAAGKSAFMILVLRDHGKPRNAGDEVIGFGGFNSLPRTKMLNPEARSADEVPEAEKVLLGDLGVSLTPRCRRKGYAREAVCAMTEFGFATLGVGYMHMDTEHDNEGLRGLMRNLGIEEKVGSGVEVDDAVLKFAWKSFNYDWDRQTWERVKEGLKARGKWPL